MSVVVGIVASFVSLYATVPQVLRAARTRSAEGVSWSSLVLSLATFTIWVVYSVAVADRIQLVNNTVALGLLATLAVMLVRAGGSSDYRSALAAVVASAVASMLLLDVSNAFTVAMAATTVSSLRLVPQTRLALSRAPLWGLDPWGTLLAWLGMALWLAYGILVGDHAVVICCGIGVSMQSTVVAFRLPPRRTIASLAGGRLGPRVARLAVPVAARFPQAGQAGVGYGLAA